VCLMRRECKALRCSFRFSAVSIPTLNNPRGVESPTVKAITYTILRKTLKPVLVRYIGSNISAG
jgi:hypothetical protein